MRILYIFTVLEALALLVAACSPPGAAASRRAAAKDSGETAEAGAAPLAAETPTATAAAMAVGTATIPPAETAGFADCPVTRPPQPAFVPPSPWPATPPGEDEFWFGQAGLWTALPESGSWRQLALGEKFWWWSEAFDVNEDSTPDLTLTARRLDGEVPLFQVSEATNGYHPSFNWAMLHGVELPSPGCWEFTGEFKGHPLSLVLWVPGG